MIGYEVRDVRDNDLIASFPDATSFEIKNDVVAFMKTGVCVGAIKLDLSRVIRVIDRKKETVNAAK